MSTLTRRSVVLGATVLGGMVVSQMAKAEPEAFVAALVITFRITDDDKEHQDAVSVQVIDKNNLVVFDKEVVPATGDNGNGDDQNAYYWPKDGDGKHPHSFNVGLNSVVPLSRFEGSKITIRSYTNGDHSDFESWIASVDVQAIGSIGSRPVRLNGAGSQIINFQNDTSPGSYTFTMNLG